MTDKTSWDLLNNADDRDWVRAIDAATVPVLDGIVAEYDAIHASKELASRWDAGSLMRGHRNRVWKERALAAMHDRWVKQDAKYYSTYKRTVEDLPYEAEQNARVILGLSQFEESRSREEKLDRAIQALRPRPASKFAAFGEKVASGIGAVLKVTVLSVLAVLAVFWASTWGLAVWGVIAVIAVLLTMSGSEKRVLDAVYQNSPAGREAAEFAAEDAYWTQQQREWPNKRRGAYLRVKGFI